MLVVSIPAASTVAAAAAATAFVPFTLHPCSLDLVLNDLWKYAPEQGYAENHALCAGKKPNGSVLGRKPPNGIK
jgi:hypothetical protein